LLVKDQSGAGNDGRLKGLEPDPEDALNFNGVDDYIALPAMSVDYTRGFTVEAWVYYRSFKKWSRIIDFKGQQRNDIFLANWDDTNTLSFQVYPGAKAQIKAENVLEPKVWLHLAATVDGAGNAALYKNGELLVEGKINVPKSEERHNNYIGRSPWGPPDGYFDGDMREVRIWNVARSQTEIQAKMNQTLEVGEPGLVGYWRFDKPYVEAGRVVKDQQFPFWINRASGIYIIEAEWL
jgi:hypothetical protein